MEGRDAREESDLACAPGPPPAVLSFTAFFPFCDGVSESGSVRPTWVNVLTQSYPGSRRDGGTKIPVLCMRARSPLLCGARAWIK